MVVVAWICRVSMAQAHQRLVFQDAISFVSCLLAIVADLIHRGPLQLTCLYSMKGAVCPAMRTSSLQCCCLVRQWSKAALGWWLRKVAQSLDLEHYLLPPRAPQQPGLRPHPQQLLAAPAPAHPVATPPQTSPSAQAPQHTAFTSNEMPSPAEAEESRPEQHIAALSESTPVFGSQRISEAAVRGNHMHHRQIISGSEDGEDIVPLISGVCAPDQADLHPGSSAQLQSPLATQQSASSQADLACENSQDGCPSTRALAEGNELGTMHSSEYWYGVRFQSEGEGSQQTAQSSAAFSQVGHQPDVPSSSWEGLQADSHPKSPANSAVSSAQAGPSTEAAVGNKRELHKSALLSDRLLRASAAGPQLSVASGAGQLPSPGAQAAPVGDSHEAVATAEGLAANTQLDDSSELTSQLLTVGVLLMLTLLLFMTGLLTLPCIIGKLAG